MNLNTFGFTVVISLYLGTTLLKQPVWAQLPTMTADQAQQALLSYVQPSDAGLFNPTVTSPVVAWMDGTTGHTMYVFHGRPDRTGGKYQIDGVTGQKDIQYGKQSTWDGQPGDAPPLLSEAQLEQIANTFAQQHFPGYAAGIGVFPPPNPPSAADGNFFYISFEFIAGSGAELPIWCRLIVEEDTGYVSDYTELNLPINVSTVPQLTQDQALTIGKDWIAQNISTDPTASQLLSDQPPGYSLVKLKVVVDPLLNQALVYEIDFASCRLTIDAHSGAVVGEDGLAGIGPTMKYEPDKTGSNRELLRTLRYGNSMITQHSAVATQGQVYLWAGFLKSLGIQSQQRKGWLLLSNESKHLRLPVRSSAGGQGKTAWDRKGSLYVPLSQLGELTNRVVANPGSGEVEIKLSQGPASGAATEFPRKQ